MCSKTYFCGPELLLPLVTIYAINSVLHNYLIKTKCNFKYQLIDIISAGNVLREYGQAVKQKGIPFNPAIPRFSWIVLSSCSLRH